MNRTGRISPGPRLTRRLLVVMTLGLGSLGLPGQTPAGSLLPLPGLIFLSTPAAGTQGLGPGAAEFSAAVRQGLAQSGAFRLLDPPAPAGAAAQRFAVWRRTGARFLFRAVSRAVGRGRLAVEGQCLDLETSAVVLTRRFQGEAGAIRRMANRMVDVLVGQVTGTPGVTDSMVVFARQTAPGIQEIFALDRDGKGLRQLTRFASLTTYPVLSRDGRLAVVTYKGGPPQIWGQERPNGPFKRLNPGDGNQGLPILDLAWSPDGTRLAYAQGGPKGRTDLYVLDLGTHRSTRLTQDGQVNRAPCWGPGGTRLAYVSDRDGGPQIFIMGQDGSHPRRLTADPAPKDAVAWAAQGGRIAYCARANGASGIYSLSPDGGPGRLLFSSAAPVEALCWAPDGRWLMLCLLEGRLGIASLDGAIQTFAAGWPGCRFPQWTRAPFLQPSPTHPDPDPAPHGAIPHP